MNCKPSEDATRTMKLVKLMMEFEARNASSWTGECYAEWRDLTVLLANELGFMAPPSYLDCKDYRPVRKDTQ